jgi:hypothetical protein
VCRAGWVESFLSLTPSAIAQEGLSLFVVARVDLLLSGIAGINLSPSGIAWVGLLLFKIALVDFHFSEECGSTSHFLKIARVNLSLLERVDLFHFLG